MNEAPLNSWNPSRYSDDARFVRDGGLPLVDQLRAQSGESVLDLGCGPGQLSRKIADGGARVVGLDASLAMIDEARRAYPELCFEVGRGEALAFDREFDAIFSNAALHWMPRASDVAMGMFRALKPGGRLVAEFGGFGNVAEVVRATNQALVELALASPARALGPWYFPRLGEYAALLEACGFSVGSASWFPRPTPMPDRDGVSGLAAWLEIFASQVLPLASEERARFLERVEALARPRLFRDGVWWIDYVRLRIEAAR
jgi:trans-aconitate methyltransferase